MCNMYKGDAFLTMSFNAFQDDLYPGLLYFLSAGLVTVSCVCAYFTTETNNRSMNDTIASKQNEVNVQGDRFENTKL